MLRMENIVNNDPASPPDPESPKDGEGMRKEKEEARDEKEGFAKFAAKVVADSLGAMFQGDNNKFEFHSHQHDHHDHPINDRRTKWQRHGPSTSDSDFTLDGTTKEVTKDIPVSTEQLDDWFYLLSDYERCFVLVMAVLHGRRVSDVTQRAKQLYTPFREAQKKQKKGDEQDEQVGRNS